jgi:4-hydroxybenzoate polyprenyltransferase
MQVETQAGQTPAGKMIGKARLLLESIKFEHTIFALPFAYLGMALAARGTHGWPGWDKLLWVTWRWSARAR